VTLIKSISGIRGTIGGMPGDNLTPPDVVKFTSAYARLIQLQNPQKQCAVVIARDSRISGHMVHQLVSGTLMACGIHVLDLGTSNNTYNRTRSGASTGTGRYYFNSKP